MTLRNDIDSILFSEEDILKITKQLAAELTEDYKDKEPIFVALLKGSIMFMGDLVKHIDTHLELDFMDVSSYVGTKSTGDIKILKDLSSSIEGRHVVIVEDIVETGATLNYIIDFLKGRKPASVEIVTLLDKPVDNRKLDVNVKYIGTEIPEGFVVGYGLDFNEKYRNLPYIGLLKPELYE